MALLTITIVIIGSLSNEEVPGLPPPDSESEVMLGGRIFPGFPRKVHKYCIRFVILCMIYIIGGSTVN